MTVTDHVQATGAVAGYRPERTLRLSVELRRQFKRRRTIGIFALMAAGIGVDQFTPRRRLEDAFLALVGES